MKPPASSTSTVADSLSGSVPRIRNLAVTSQYLEPLIQERVNSIISNGRPAMLAVLLLALASVSRGFAQVDDHNPVGVTGIFNGNVQTACSYDPLTHSAHRAIDDIVVPGSIGKYPLKMTRYYNSRRFRGTPGLGPGWSHEYWWSWDFDIGKVEYPSGNVWENHCETPVGVSDWPGPNDLYGNPTFRLADGGTVVFNGSGQPTRIIDPYGQTTVITYSGFLIDRVTEPGGRYLRFTYNGPQAGLLSKVEAFDGRGNLIDWVNYNYAQKPGGGTGPDQWCLTTVTYSDGTSATYTYEIDNVPNQPTRGSFKFWPLVSTCNDVRYHGPMPRIGYDYQSGGPHGAITAERYSPSDGVKGLMVSSIDPPLPSPLSGGQGFQMPTDFTETRGDGSVSRTFHYTDLHVQRRDEPVCPDISGGPPTQMLLNYTDFQGHTTTLDYDSGNNNEKWYVKSVRDANIHTTLYERGPAPPQGIGEIKKITHPDGSHIDYTYNDAGHYLSTATEYTPANQFRSQTIDYRDSNTHKIYQSDYKDGNSALLARETFAYCDQVDSQCSNNPLGQLKTHRLKNGAYVHYRYDARGLLIDKWEPTWNSSAVETEPKTHYDYYTSGRWTDRIRMMTPPANYPYNHQASETYEYDRELGANGITNFNGAAVAGRGLITKITHADGTFHRFAYDAYGNKRWEDNELRNATTYAYDEYNRVLNVTRPLNEITTYTYNPTNGTGSAYKHTTNNPDTVKVRVNATTSITTRNVYDENFRKTSSTAADGTASEATTWFHYDPVGNQDWVTDPRGTAGRTYPNADPAYTTYTDYDNRNRKWRVREPLGRTTEFHYDDGTNLTRIIRPDQTIETKAYDGMNRVITDTVPKEQGANILTQFQYYPWNVQSASLLKKVIDGETHSYQFEYDPSGLKTKMTYPDGSYRTWSYDDAHNLASRTTVAGETQNFGYDNRNRKILEWWDGFPVDGEWRVFDYDDANHLTLATNGTGAYWTNFIADVRRSYDDAGRLIQDRQTVYVNGVPVTKDVNYPTHDDDGKLLRMYVNGVSPAYDYTFSYDAMGRFEKIFATGQPNPYFQYHYDAASNETQRDNLFDGVLQIHPRDNLNRMRNLDLKKGGNTLGHEGYGYDEMSRLQSVTREDNKQDQFTYYKDGELNIATYGLGPTGTPTPPPTPTPPSTPTPPPTPTPTPPPGQVATPTFNPDGAYYVTCANSYTFNVAISTITSGARIRWTTDGSNWSDMANGQMATFTVGANQTKTLQAYAYKSGMTNSDIHSADYSFERECGGQAPMAPASYPLDNPGNLPGVPDLGGTYTYTLDKAGNRTSVNGTNYTPNTINQYTSAGGSPVTNGNDHEIQTYGGFTYIYMRDQELIRISAPGLTYDLAYDALGRCVKRTANNSATTYVYDGEKPILEYNAGGGLLGFNLYGKGIDEIIERGAYGADNQWHWYFLNQDHEGSVTHLTDGTGAIIERYRYDAFGAPTIYAPNWTVRTASSYSNRFLFTGREYDGAWVYEYRARVYHSALGRFMSEDPKLFDAGDYNLFRYCHNDPSDLTDPMGLAGDAGGGAAIDTPSVDRLRAYEHAKEMFGGGAIEIGSLNYAICQMQGLTMAQVSLAGRPDGMRVERAIPINGQTDPLLDRRTERNLTTLAQPVRDMARSVLYHARADLHLDVRIIQGTRTYAEQNALYAQGRTDPGSIVTNARGGYSLHNFGVAFDVGLFRGQSYIEGGSGYISIGHLGETAGLEWGGRWPSFQDVPHFQYPGLSLGILRSRLEQGLSPIPGY